MYMCTCMSYRLANFLDEAEEVDETLRKPDFVLPVISNTCEKAQTQTITVMHTATTGMADELIIDKIVCHL